MDTRTDPTQEAFQRARIAFRKKITNSRSYEQILKESTVEDVYGTASKIQEKMAGKGRLKFLRRIEAFLRRLNDYATTIDTFVSSKADVLALIWGPIRLILLWATEVTNAMDSIASAMERVAEALPRFASVARAFNENQVIKYALSLFYEDILDFNAAIIDFFATTHSWRRSFKALWTGPQKKIDVIVSNMEKHRRLLTEEVTFLDITEAREARDRSLEHFAEARASELSLKYTALKAGRSLPQYRDRLSYLQERSVPGCDTWLLRDAAFLSWTDTSHQSTELFWLRGNPGAGKTYLSASIVQYVKPHVSSNGRVLFAFVSYAENRWLNARSIFSSLLFQAADQDIDLRSVLIHTPERDFDEHNGQARLLKDFLTSAPGTSFIIIDGLDEVDEHEQKILLQQVEDISRGCKRLRLLISSRMEHNISKMLDDKAVSVRVDKRNFGGIQTYIDHRTERWMSEREFDPEVKRELRELIAPLSYKADGMFLFARILLDNLDYVGSIEELRCELRAPPESLNDAYHRIFDRINKGRPLQRARARKVLGWIGCAPISLTRYEMEQALSLDENLESHSGRLPRLLINTSFEKLCGPIVETVGEQVQFVHFTVKEYLFSSKIPNFIDSNQATTDLARALLAYLGAAGILDPDLDDHEIDDNILNGTYRLFEYAYNSWPHMFRQVQSTPDNATSFGNLLLIIMQEAGTNAWTPETDDVPRSTYKNAHLESSLPEVYRVVCETFHFRLSDRRWDWNRGNSDSWVYRDPLVTSEMLVRIQERHEALAAEVTPRSRLMSHYGINLFKCTFPFCPHSHRGFETQRTRDEHMQVHGRPWKCSVSNCEFSSIGYQSRHRRDDHWMKYHLPDTGQLSAADFDLEKLSAAEAQTVLYVLVSQENDKKLKQLLSAPVSRKLKSETLAAARKMAAKAGSFLMTELLAPSTEAHVPCDLVIAAVDSQDVAFAEAYISRSDPLEAPRIMRSVVRTQSEEMYHLWETFLLSVPQLPDVPYVLGRHISDFFDKLFDSALLRAIKGKPLEEYRVIQSLKKVSPNFESRLPGKLLVRVARSNCSIRLAQELLAIGADVDYPCDFNDHALTPLHHAAKKTSREAALFMEFLIGKGAAAIGRPYIGANDPERIGREKGAKGIALYVGQTFEELRVQADIKRRQIDLRPGHPW